jgi:hypothetical protein
MRRERPPHNLYWIPKACGSHKAATAVSDGHQPSVEKVGELYLLKLARHNVADQERTALDSDQALDDGSPTWPPYAKWSTIASV